MGINHNDVIVDSDAKCIIDVETRKISNVSGKSVLLQNDHNSERVGFKIQRYVDGHDMLSTNRISVNYMNVKHKGSYLVNDAALSDDGEFVTFTWLIGHDATGYAGPLIFGVNFRYIEPQTSTVTYNWSTIPCSMFVVTESYNFDTYVNTDTMTDLCTQITRSYINEYIEDYINDAGYAKKTDVPNLARTLNEGEDELNLVAGKNWGDGAWVALRKTSREDKPGSFEFFAFNTDRNNWCSLFGSSDGTLTWNGKRILTEDDLQTLNNNGTVSESTGVSIDQIELLTMLNEVFSDD